MPGRNGSKQIPQEQWLLVWGEGPDPLERVRAAIAEYNAARGGKRHGNMVASELLVCTATYRALENLSTQSVSAGASSGSGIIVDGVKVSVSDTIDSPYTLYVRGVPKDTTATLAGGKRTTRKQKTETASEGAMKPVEQLPAKQKRAYRPRRAKTQEELSRE